MITLDMIKEQIKSQLTFSAAFVLEDVDFSGLIRSRLPFFTVGERHGAILDVFGVFDGELEAERDPPVPGDRTLDSAVKDCCLPSEVGDLVLVFGEGTLSLSADTDLGGDLTLDESAVGDFASFFNGGPSG